MGNQHDASTFVRQHHKQAITLPVELSPRVHRQLIAWCQDTAEALDVRAQRPRLTAKPDRW
ncbi:hypothetical protein GCM10023321_59060 [Pseudonocardia eucalypti]|uniref:Uncharacterized protein n=1 Tax=Pseudonocardia eucalypti TaxID=648755 RepID=A0ABP9QSV7_9PSEU|nr:hypothetical protein [Pseudonocardia eucalypti]